MKSGYTADEILEIAEDLELEAERFYRRAAGKMPDEQSRRLFLDLAEEEKAHFDSFRKLRKDMAAAGEPSLLEEPDEAVSAYLQIVAESGVSRSAGRPQDLADLPEDQEGILALALAGEMDAILYYCSMKDLAVNDVAKNVVDSIIREERRHAVKLAEHRDAAG